MNEISLHRPGMSNTRPTKVLVRPSDNFSFSGFNEDYEEEFREVAEKHFGAEIGNYEEILRENLFFF